MPRLRHNATLKGLGGQWYHSTAYLRHATYNQVMQTTTTPDLQLPTPLLAKVLRLQALFDGFGSALVAFSGGVDSTLVLKVGVDRLGERCIAATGLSASYAPEEMTEAKAVADQLGARHVMAHTMELTDPRYADNSHQRCFFCKSELYTKLFELAATLDLATVVDGTNLDDTGDFRPGIRAGKQLGVESPLVEAGMTKADVRAVAKAWGLPTWDKPAAACLSSRFAYGDPITVEKLRKVSSAETALRSLGLRGFRVRHHGDIARLEIPLDQIATVMERRDEVTSGVKAAGYAYVALDLDGFRSGSMNEVLHARVASAGLRGSGPA